MTKTGWIALCLAVPGLGMAPRPGVAQSRKPIEVAVRIDSALLAAARAGFAGTVLVASGDTILVESGYGAIRGVAVTDDSRFWIASTAKQFVGAAILLCRERGLLALSDSLGRFFTGVPADMRGITVRQLLSHTSGIAQSYASEGQSGREAAVRAMLAEGRDRSAAGSFRYSNSNIQLAVAIVETVTGQSYQDFARSELWRPAGLSQTGFAGDAGAGAVVAAIDPTPGRLTTPSWGGEGVYSTGGDLFRWYRALSDGRILSHASVHELFTPVTPISEGQSALTWFLGRSPAGQERRFVRGNEDFGPNSLLYAYPERGTVVIVLTHAGSADGQTSWSRAIHAELEALLSL